MADYDARVQQDATASGLSDDGRELTAEEIAARVGDVPRWRILTEPPPGTATEVDVERVRRQEKRLCELIEGVLVEKVSCEISSTLGLEIVTSLVKFVKPRRLGWLRGPNGLVWLSRTRLRAPDVSFMHHSQHVEDPLLTRMYADTAPALAVEVFSPGNTVPEIERKREEFFEAGTELFWVVYPERQEVEVWTGPQDVRVLRGEEILDGGTVLPGFAVKVADLFVNMELRDEPEA
jgi:Uma2 family endonuclease